MILTRNHKSQTVLELRGEGLGSSHRGPKVESFVGIRPRFYHPGFVTERYLHGVIPEKVVVERCTNG